MTKEEVDALLEEFDKATPGQLRRSLIAKMFRDRRDLLAICETVKTWLELNARSGSVLYPTVVAVINAAKETS